MSHCTYIVKLPLRDIKNLVAVLRKFNVLLLRNAQYMSLYLQHIMHTWPCAQWNWRGCPCASWFWAGNQAECRVPAVQWFDSVALPGPATPSTKRLREFCPDHFERFLSNTQRRRRNSSPIELLESVHSNITWYQPCVAVELSTQP